MIKEPVNFGYPMSHDKLSLDVDKDLINKILDDTSMRYIVLFLYVIRNDLFRDLSDPNIVESYERVILLDEVYKGNLLTFWEPWFTELALNLGFIRNLRSLREFEQKEDDFIVKFCDPIMIENDTLVVPDDTLFLFIVKKFPSLTKRDFNLALTRLKGIRCQSTGAIHPFIYETREDDYTLSDDLYYILDEFGNIYQAIKIENTIQGFYERFKEIQTKLDDFLEIFDPVLINKTTIKKVFQAVDENKEIIPFLKEEKIKLSDKFDYGDVDKNTPIFKEWHETFQKLFQFKKGLDEIYDKIMDLQSYYSGKKKKYEFLRFIEIVSYNEEDIITSIKETLINLRDKIIPINEYVSNLSQKQVKLLNLDYERYLLTNK